MKFVLIGFDCFYSKKGMKIWKKTAVLVTFLGPGSRSSIALAHQKSSRIWNFQIQVALLSGRIPLILHICSTPFLELSLLLSMYAGINLMGPFVYYISWKIEVTGT